GSQQPAGCWHEPCSTRGGRATGEVVTGDIASPHRMEIPMEQHIKKIIIGYDFSSAARHALVGTLGLARATGAELTIVTAVPSGIDDAEVERIMDLSDYKLGRLEATSIGLEDIERYVKADVEKFDTDGI